MQVFPTKTTGKNPILKIVAIASIGGGLEMYDFVIYAFFAPIIGKLFFPPGNSFIQLLSAFTVFAIGYFIRPLGAFVFGHYGDTIGRKKTLLMTIVLMALATTLLACLPVYAHIGLIATLLLVSLRLLQGFAVGGDLPGAITFVSEYAPPSQRGFYCSWIYTGVNLGLTLAAIISTLISTCLTTSQIEAFGWRIGFGAGLVLAIVGYYFRSTIEETPHFKQLLQTKRVSTSPLIEVFKWQRPAFFKALGVVCLGAVVIGHMLFMTTYLHTVVKFDMREALLINTAIMVVWTGFMLVMGYCADKWGRKTIIRFSSLSLMLFSHEFYSCIASGELTRVIAGLLGFAFCMSGIIGVMPSILSELFPTHLRNSGIGSAYNIGFALFCSVTPLVMTAMTHRWGPVAPAYWIMAAAAITFISTLLFAETASRELLPSTGGAAGPPTFF